MIAADPFIHTILERPEANEPRLVFADWLEEQGNPLAELIRVQCALLRPEDGDPRQLLRQREQELLEQYGPGWLAPVKELGLAGKFRRGFLEVPVTGTRNLLDLGDRLFSLPYVMHVILRDGALDDDTLRDLANSPHFARVHSLHLERSRIGNEGLRLLCASPFRGRLSRLNLNSTGISSTGLRGFVEAFDLSSLTDLRLAFNGIAEGGARALSLCPRLTRLRALDLSNNRIGSIGADYLAESPYLNQLQSLDVRGNNIGAMAKRNLRHRYGPHVSMRTNVDYSI
jgi:uncharacterized protein (TIGR02996 family)